MIIRTEQGNFDTDQLKMIDRLNPDLVMVTIENEYGSEVLVFTGLAAQQAWCIVTELAEDVKPKKRNNPRKKKE